MTIKREWIDRGIFSGAKPTSDLQGSATAVLAELDTIDPPYAEARLRAYIQEAEAVIDKFHRRNESDPPLPSSKVARAKAILARAERTIAEAGIVGAARAVKARAEDAITHLLAGNAELAVLNALEAGEHARFYGLKVAEPNYKLGKALRLERKARAKKTNEAKQRENKKRDASLEKIATRLLSNGNATKRSVSQYMVDNGLSRDLSVSRLRVLLRKAGIR